MAHDPNPSCGQAAYDWDEIDHDLDGGVLGNKLCEAAEAGDTQALVKLIKLGVKPWTADYDGRTAAHLAAAEGQLKVS